MRQLSFKVRYVTVLPYKNANARCYFSQFAKNFLQESTTDIHYEDLIAHTFTVAIHNGIFY